MATKIRIARKKKQLTQRGLAKELKVSPSAVAQWETSATSPGLDHRVELSKVLDLPFVELLPEADTIGELSIKDPETIAFVRKYLELPPQVREALLMQVVATAESLRAPRGPAVALPPVPTAAKKRS